MRKALVVLAVVLLSLVSVSPAFAADGSRVRMGEDVVVVPGEKINGDVTSFGGNVLVQGEVYGSVVAIGGNVTVSGKVTRDVTALGGNVDLQATAVVENNVVAVGGKITKAEGAVVRGDTVEGRPGQIGNLPEIPVLLAFQRGANPLLSLLGAIVGTIVLSLVWLVVGVLALALFPRQLATVSETLEETPGRTIVVGILTAILLPFGILVATVILAITIVGILVIPLFFLGLAAAALYGLAAIGYLLGRRLLQAFGVQEISPMAAGVIGLLALALVTILPASLLSCLGAPLLYLVTSIGLAAVILSRFGTLRPLKRVTQVQPF